jgi:rRNA pseudouridine-1189 N-methylase Emg1 (Nep1/Mra1 family)
VMVVGAVAKGDPGMTVVMIGKENDYVKDVICMSQYPLSATACIARITNAFEGAWGVK